MLYSLVNFFLPGVILILALLVALVGVMPVASQALIEHKFVMGSKDQRGPRRG